MHLIPKRVVWGQELIIDFQCDSFLQRADSLKAFSGRSAWPSTRVSAATAHRPPKKIGAASPWSRGARPPARSHQRWNSGSENFSRFSTRVPNAIQKVPPGMNGSCRFVSPFVNFKKPAKPHQMGLCGCIRIFLEHG